MQAKTDLPKFESFLASYFSEGFTNSSVYVRSNGQPWFEAADKSYGVWQAFPRDDQAVSIIQDGRWKIPPSPVDWVIRPRLAKPARHSGLPGKWLARCDHVAALRIALASSPPLKAKAIVQCISACSAKT